MSEPTAQRFYRAPCPACGAPVEFKSAQSTHAVCAYCQSTVVREGEVLKRIGKMAELFDDHSLLQLGASGQIDGQGFTLVGRLQYAYGEGDERGTWTEWHALQTDGSSAYLSEDNGAYVYSRPVSSTGAVPPASELPVGHSVALGGQRYVVSSNQPVTLIAAQGELPKLPPLGQPFTVVEVRSEGGDEASQRVLSFDYGSAPPAVTLGRGVVLADLNMSGLKAESAQEGSGRQFACPNCGSPVTVKLAESKAITCPQCHTLIDLSKGIGGELRHAVQDEPVRPLIALGSVGQLNGIHWQVVGFQHRLGQSPDGDESFGWTEYLLYNAKHGFAFLVDAEDGWSLVRPTTGAPKVTGNGAKAEYAGATYSRTWSYNAETSYVLGESYWPVRRGQKTFNRDYAVGERLLSLEQTGSEQTWSAGAKLDFNQVARAFKLQDEAALFRRQDAAPVSLGDAGSTLIKIIVVMMLVLAGMWLLAAMFGASSSGSGSGWGRSSGGSFGGYSSGGGHK